MLNLGESKARPNALCKRLVQFLCQWYFDSEHLHCSFAADAIPSFIKGTPFNLPYTPHRITIPSNPGVFKPAVTLNCQVLIGTPLVLYMGAL